MMIEKLLREDSQNGVFFFVGKKLLHEGQMKIGELYEL
jgi:hypothetical protein